MHKRVLLHEPEQCAQCGAVYISLYKLSTCQEHSGLTELQKPRIIKVPKIAPPGTPSYSEADDTERGTYAFIGKSKIGAA